MEFWVAPAFYLKPLVEFVEYSGGDRGVEEVLGVKTSLLLEKEMGIYTKLTMKKVEFQGWAFSQIYFTSKEQNMMQHAVIGK